MPGGNGAVDGAQGAGDVEQPVRLGAADAEVSGAVSLPRGVAERCPDASVVNVTRSEPGFGAGADDVRAAAQSVGDADRVTVGIDERGLVAVEGSEPKHGS